MEAIQKNSRTVDLLPIEHIRYPFSHFIKQREVRCHVDVVTEKYFPKLLRTIEKEMDKAVREVFKDLEPVMDSAKSIYMISKDSLIARCKRSNGL